MPEKPPPFPFPILCSLVHYYSQSSPLRCDSFFATNLFFFHLCDSACPKAPSDRKNQTPPITTHQKV